MGNKKSKNQPVVFQKEKEKENEVFNKVIVGLKKSLEISSSPLPRPQNLEGYKKISKDFPERIMKMAENHSIHSMDIEKSRIKNHIVSNYLGQGFSFIIAIGILVLLYLKDFNPLVMGVIGGVPLLGVFFANIKHLFNKTPKD